MKSIIAGLLLTLVSQVSFAAPNFECKIFSQDGITGKLSFSGADQMKQSFRLTMAERESTPYKLRGTVYVAGRVEFKSLPAETKKMILDGMASSKRPNLKPGPMVLYTNTKNPAEATISVYLMPSGEIAYIQMGMLEALCM